MATIISWLLFGMCLVSQMDLFEVETHFQFLLQKVALSFVLLLATRVYFALRSLNFIHEQMYQPKLQLQLFLHCPFCSI